MGKKRGRPIKGAQKIESLAGSADAKHRLQVIMKSISGELSIREACRQLGMEKSAFYRLREKVLASALSSLEPKASGRPRIPAPTPEEEYIAELEEKVVNQRIALEASMIREELAISMPHVLLSRRKKVPEKKSKKKKNRQNRGNA